MSLDQLIHRYLDDRAGLSAVELTELIDGLRAEPQRAVQLREHLLLDDLLGQKLAWDRRDFLAQVGQRIADFERGEEEIDRQVAELRALAEAEIQRPRAWSGSSPWVASMVAVSAIVLVAVGYLAPRMRREEPQFVAKLVAVAGEVTIEAGPRRHAAAGGEALLAGHTLRSSPGGSFTVAYEDGTAVRVAEASRVTFDLDSRTAAKRVRLERGELAAQVEPQSIGMRFQSPQALATVVGTSLRMTVSQTETRLEVGEGKVQLQRSGDGESVFVSARQTALASSDALAVRPLAWPDDRSTAAYLYSPFERLDPDQPLMVARNPATGNLRETLLAPRGSAIVLQPRLHLDLSGGWFSSEEASEDLLAAFAARDELTLEVVLAAAAGQPPGGRIVAFADVESGANFRLTQEGGGLAFVLRTDDVAPPAKFAIPIAPDRERLHLAVTYREGELTAYLDGAAVAYHKRDGGSLALWRPGPLTVGADAAGRNGWQGVVEGLALYSRALSPADVAQNARSFGALSADVRR